MHINCIHRLHREHYIKLAITSGCFVTSIGLLMIQIDAHTTALVSFFTNFIWIWKG